MSILPLLFFGALFFSVHRPSLSQAFQRARRLTSPPPSSLLAARPPPSLLAVPGKPGRRPLRSKPARCPPPSLLAVPGKPGRRPLRSKPARRPLPSRLLCRAPRRSVLVKCREDLVKAEAEAQPEEGEE
ncbi:hypothetical protein PVAP13_1NG337519 [Panicum virgatum]|uniref:Uncharacterized protein n=1 Tax=Panicum virgatum TaxID=38727 RepID=A0A8T0WRR6_PANVG|nr:hypothetical protein PVAP13_1NG337519 [Panicum virgatum]